MMVPSRVTARNRRWRISSGFSKRVSRSANRCRSSGWMTVCICRPLCCAPGKPSILKIDETYVIFPSRSILTIVLLGSSASWRSRASLLARSVTHWIDPTYAMTSPRWSVAGTSHPRAHPTSPSVDVAQYSSERGGRGWGCSSQSSSACCAAASSPRHPNPSHASAFSPVSCSQMPPTYADVPSRVVTTTPIRSIFADAVAVATTSPKSSTVDLSAVTWPRVGSRRRRVRLLWGRFDG